ncbi:MAG: RsmB/NOP family class I SAM-dependent RNA methyltransferase [Candidatus Omnitrophica bacterium]|nr:RsmB/NOP family class I SAM-dependent RNA methyltransferase [Candidatus Omnitrophota bacterium]
MIIPKEYYDRVVKGFFSPRALSVRINTLKTGKGELLEALKKKNIIFKEVSWIDEALVLEGVSPAELGAADLATEGLIYRQGLSSMLPVILLDPHPADDVLDMCAAPGSKATQIAARMNNQGKLVCVEAVRGRYYKLKRVAQLMGAANISFHLTDARKFRSHNQLFDKILVDAPCSSEGRFKADVPKTFAYWSPRKIKEMVRKQKGLLLAASRLLRPGGVLIYSTCTFAPEENEGVVHWLLKKTEGTLEAEKVHVPAVESYPAVTEWKGKAFNEQVKRCLRVLPGEDTEGFFIAGFKKNQ